MTIYLGGQLKKWLSFRQVNVNYKISFNRVNSLTNKAKSGQLKSLNHNSLRANSSTIVDLPTRRAPSIRRAVFPSFSFFQRRIWPYILRLNILCIIRQILNFAAKIAKISENKEDTFNYFIFPEVLGAFYPIPPKFILSKYPVSPKFSIFSTHSKNSRNIILSTKVCF